MKVKTSRDEALNEYREAANMTDGARRRGPVCGNWSSFWTLQAIAHVAAARSQYPRIRRVHLTAAGICRREARAARCVERASRAPELS